MPRSFTFFCSSPGILFPVKMGTLALLAKMPASKEFPLPKEKGTQGGWVKSLAQHFPQRLNDHSQHQDSTVQACMHHRCSHKP